MSKWRKVTSLLCSLKIPYSFCWSSFAVECVFAWIFWYILGGFQPTTPFVIKKVLLSARYIGNNTLLLRCWHRSQYTISHMCHYRKLYLASRDALKYSRPQFWGRPRNVVGPGCAGKEGAVLDDLASDGSSYLSSLLLGSNILSSSARKICLWKLSLMGVLHLLIGYL